MMRKTLLLALALVLCVGGMAQNASPEQTAARLFREFSTQSALHADLWGRDLYGSVLLVDPNTRRVWANRPDTEGALTDRGDVYTGQLPPDIPIANTAMEWSGVEWAMILLPTLTSLDDVADRVNIMAHESFHVLQPALGFTLSGGENVHMDRKEARITFRMEMEALRKALTAANNRERDHHLTNAFLFRAHRRALLPGADKAENALEMNEGVAEYTGEASSGRAQEEKAAYFERRMDGILTAPSLVRSFAYATIAAYGWMLDDVRPGWNRRITAETDLTAFMIDEFGLTIPAPTERLVTLRAAEYGGEVIVAEEREREQRRQEQMERYVDLFVTRPHLTINLEAMQISFNPNNILSLEEHGTVYPTMYLKDNWGVLDVTGGGALMSPGWNAITLAMPFEQDGNVVRGEGWRLELSENYAVVVDPDTGNATLAGR